MTTLNISLNHICSGGGHMRLAVSVDGGAVSLVDMDTDRVSSPFTAEDVETVLAVILKLYAKGKTRAQIKNGLQTGLVITL